VTRNGLSLGKNDLGTVITNEPQE